MNSNYVMLKRYKVHIYTSTQCYTVGEQRNIKKEIRNLNNIINKAKDHGDKRSWRMLPNMPPQDGGSIGNTNLGPKIKIERLA